MSVCGILFGQVLKHQLDVFHEPEPLLGILTHAASRQPFQTVRNGPIRNFRAIVKRASGEHLAKHHAKTVNVPACPGGTGRRGC